MMRSILSRISAAAVDLAIRFRERGWWTAAEFLWKRLFFCSESLLYERRGYDMTMKQPDSLRIVEIGPAEEAGYRKDMFEAGVGSDISNFRRGATCYLGYIGDKPTCVGWSFAAGRLLKRLKYGDNAAYLAGFFVREEFQGRGVYPFLVQHIGNRMSGTKDTFVVQTGLDNVPSQKGLEKAGFVRKGRLRIVILCGLMISCKLG